MNNTDLRTRSRKTGAVRRTGIQAFLLLFLLLFPGYDPGPSVSLFAQGGSQTMNAPSGDMSFSYDANDRFRPAKPTRKRDDLHFPPGFLQLSSPSSAESGSGSKDGKKGLDDPKSNRPASPESNASAAQPAISRDDLEPNIERFPARDDTPLLGVIVAAALLGIFVFADYRYRCWLQQFLMQNNRLLSPDAVSSDFDELYLANGSDPVVLSGVCLADGYTSSFGTDAAAGSFSSSDSVSPSAISTTGDEFYAGTPGEA